MLLIELVSLPVYFDIDTDNENQGQDEKDNQREADIDFVVDGLFTAVPRHGDQAVGGRKQVAEYNHSYCPSLSDNVDVVERSDNGDVPFEGNSRQVADVDKDDDDGKVEVSHVCFLETMHGKKNACKETVSDAQPENEDVGCVTESFVVVDHATNHKVFKNRQCADGDQEDLSLVIADVRLKDLLMAVQTRCVFAAVLKHVTVFYEIEMNDKMFYNYKIQKEFSHLISRSVR